MILFFTFLHFVHDLCPALLAPLLPLIKQSFNLTYFQTGLLLSAFTIPAGLSQLPMGWLGDRWNRGLLIAAGVGGVGITTLAAGLSQTYYLMLFILIIMGVLAGAYHPSAISILPRYCTKEKTGSVIGLHSLGGATSFAIGPVLGGLIAGALGWRFAFITLSIPAILSIPIVLKKLKSEWQIEREHANNSKADIELERELPSIGQVFRPIIIPFILVVIVQLIAGSAVAFIPLYLVDKHGIAPVYAAMLLGLHRGGGMAGTIVGGRLSDRWGRKQTFFSALITIGPILYLLTILPFNNAFIIILITFGLLMTMRMTAIQTLIVDSVDIRRRGTVLGIYFFLSMEGTSLVLPVAGYFMDIFGTAKVFTALALAAVGISVVALPLAKKTKAYTR